jgi:hypothetical protein
LTGIIEELKQACRHCVIPERLAGRMLPGAAWNMRGGVSGFDKLMVTGF